ncbi:MAG TPA: hypothetical protein VK059_02760 [Nocardioidaceae bacterium]|nr:hypothetical protein [Nocardioidaceae bacterium]
MISNAEITTCVAFAQRGTMSAASGPRMVVRDVDPIAPSTDVRLNGGDFMGVSWSPPV